jgi:hypothetical protein
MQLHRFDLSNMPSFRSHWPRGLRRGFAAAWWRGLWFRIPPGCGCLSPVSVVCWQEQVSASGWSLDQRSPTDCGASLCVIYKPHEWGGPGPLGAVAPKEKEMPSFKTSKQRKHKVASPNRKPDELTAQFSLRLLVTLWSPRRLLHRIVHTVPTFRKT